MQDMWKLGDESNQTQPYSEVKTAAAYDSRHCFQVQEDFTAP